MSDIQHSRGAARSNIFALDHDTHKIVESVVITKKEESCVLRHESTAIRMVREKLTQKDIKVHAHVYDQSRTVSNVVVAKDSLCQDQLDIWHAIKCVLKAFNEISTGPKYKEGDTWSEQLADKKESLKEHLNFVARNCANNAQILKDNIDAIPAHYQGDHDGCRLMAACVRSRRYVPSTTIITDPKAVELLTNFLHKSALYQDAEKFVLGLDTCYTEAANGALRQ